MSLAERLVLLHVGSTAALLVLLALVTVARRGVEAWTDRRSPAGRPAASPPLAHQVVRVVEPRPASRSGLRQPQVAGALSRSS